MKNSTFAIGQKFSHYQGYIWIITEVRGKFVFLESQSDGQYLKGSMTTKDLEEVIKANYYTPIA
jgi:hypothetical protein